MFRCTHDESITERQTCRRIVVCWACVHSSSCTVISLLSADTHTRTLHQTLPTHILTRRHSLFIPVNDVFTNILTKYELWQCVYNTAGLPCKLSQMEPHIPTAEHFWCITKHRAIISVYLDHTVYTTEKKLNIGEFLCRQYIWRRIPSPRHPKLAPL